MRRMRRGANAIAGFQCDAKSRDNIMHLVLSTVQDTLFPAFA
jgi:hypothetical protein